jgi:hypothetical protein
VPEAGRSVDPGFVDRVNGIDLTPTPFS